MNYLLLKPEQVKVGPRQRVDLGNLNDLATISDPKIGQIYPILIDKDNNLIDGMRRLSYCLREKLLIKCLVRENEDDSFTKQLLELYADIARKERTWQERCLTYLKLHTMEPGKSVRMWAEVLGESFANVASMLRLAQALSNKEDKELWECSNPFAATKLLIQRNIKKIEDEMNRRKALGAQPIPPAIIKHLIEETTNLEVLTKKQEPLFESTLPNFQAKPPIKISIFGSTNIHELHTPPKFSILYSPLVPHIEGVNFIIYNRFIDFVNDFQKYTSSNNTNSKFFACPIVWDLITGKTISQFPFIINCKPIAFLYGKDFEPPFDNPISSVIVEPPNEDNPSGLPDGLVQTLLDAVCREGDKVRCEWKDVIAVARSGRVPVWVEPDEKQLSEQINQLKNHYTMVLGCVEFV